MKHRKHFFLIALTIIIIAGISCSVSQTLNTSATPWETPVPTTYTLLPSTLTALRPSSTPTILLFPTFTPYPTNVPYPTAQAVSQNAVAFIANDWEHYDNGPGSLWVANIDGSGERKLVNNIDELQTNVYYRTTAVTWSPNGKWISYISDGDLWIISPDDSIIREILPITDKNNEMIYTYQWSPDSSRIAYAQGVAENSPLITVGLIDIETGETSEISSYQASPPPIALAWSPDGRYLLLNGAGFSVFDVTIRKVTKEIGGGVNCYGYDGLTWSPNSQWFYYLPRENGRFATSQICVAGLDGSNRQIDIGGTATSSPVWDKTGNYLYFSASNTDFNLATLPTYDLRLMRYDVRTQTLERILSLGTEPREWSISLSPDGRTLETHAAISDSQYSFIIIDLKSLSQTKYTVDYVDLKIHRTNEYFLETAWSPDSQNIILLAGDICTPNTVCIQHYGSFYTLNTKTGKIDLFSSKFSGKFGMDEWAVSPAVANP